MRRTHSPEKAPSRSAPVHPTAGAGSKSPITVRESLQKSGIVSSSHFSPPKERLAPASGSRLSTHFRNGMEDGSILNPNPVKAHDSGCGFPCRKILLYNPAAICKFGNQAAKCGRFGGLLYMT